MDKSLRPFITGASMIPFRRYRDGSTFRDWIRLVGQDALKQAQLERSQVDSVIVASESDMLSLQVSPAALVTDELGLLGAAAVHVEAGGASGAAALREGYIQICSGLAENVLVIGYDQTASRLSRAGVQRVYSLSFDADIEGWSGISTANLYALSFKLYCRELNANSRQAALVSVKNHGNAMYNPFAHKPMDITVDDVLQSDVISDPYRLLDCSVISDGAAAVVLSAENGGAGRRHSIRITGSGCSTDSVRLGDRSAAHMFSAKSQAARQAYSQAGVTDPGREIDVAEVYDAFSGAELQGIEALGLCPSGRAGPEMEAGRFSSDGALPVNLSGGLIGQGGAPGATGIAQAVNVYRLLCGTFEPQLQPARKLRRGLTDAHSGVCTVGIVHVIESVPPQ
ncbi:MAG: thiolase family protein [Acidiferrobacterales bacterium]|nr:thiolase family protein [Acidiferrobacterales bacterium]